MDAPTQNPLEGEGEALTAARMRQLHERAESLRVAEKRDAGEWFDIYTGIIREGVIDIASKHGDKQKAEDNLRDQSSYFADVRREFVAHGLPIAEDIELEGGYPVYEKEYLVGVEWPFGQHLTVVWPDQSKLVFKGQRALIAFGFVHWFVGFQTPYRIQAGQDLAGKSRIIDPNSPEYASYMRGRPQG
jgi:hypothetical protein